MRLRALTLAAIALTTYTALTASTANAAPLTHGPQRTNYTLNGGPGALDGTYHLNYAPGTDPTITTTLNRAATEATRYTGHTISTNPGDHTITITVGTPTCGNGCAEVTWDNGHVTDTTITLDATMPVDWIACLAIHELGHALSLGHTTDPRQIMYPTWTPGISPCDWGVGDTAGLKQVG